MFVTSDGHFIPDKNIEQHTDTKPCLSGLLRISLTEEQELLLDQEMQKVKSAGLSFHNYFYTLGRSGHAQVGLNVLANREKEPVISAGQIDVPIFLQSLGERNFQWLTSALSLYDEKTPLRVGRLLALDKSTRLNLEQIRDAFEKGRIACNSECEFNKDGSIRVKLDEVSFINDEQAFDNPRVRRSILLHARSGLIPYQDFDPHPKPVVPAHNLSIHSIRFSSGIYQSVIRPEVDNSIKHLEGGLYLEAVRSTRIGKAYGASGVRQIELYNSSDIAVEKDSVWITLDIYPTPDLEPEKLVYFSDAKETRFIHEHGISFLQATSLREAKIYQPLFENITPVRRDDGVYAKVVTPNGVSVVEWLETEKFTFNRLQTVISDENASRKKLKKILPFIQGLSHSKDQGRALVLHNMPSADKLIYLVEEYGIRSFIVKGMQTRPSDFVEGTQPAKLNVYMDGHMHETMLNLSRQGIAFTLFFDEFEEGKLVKTHIREFFKGFWCDPDSKLRFDDIEVIVNMYGWHKDAAASYAKEDVRQFFTELSEAYGRENLAISHGKGPGFMRLADEMARALNILSIGVGIDVEKIDQKPNFAPEVGLEFFNEERSYRQKLLDHWGNISIFNVGGFGTMEELAITMCSVKLFEYIPFPILLVDSSLGDHTWKDAAEQANIISTKDKLVYNTKDGKKEIDISGSPLGTAWLTNMVFCVNSYKEAGKLLTDFRKDPGAFWKKAGISAQEIQYAWDGQLKLQQKYSQNIPDFIYKGVEEYLNK